MSFNYKSAVMGKTTEIEGIAKQVENNNVKSIHFRRLTNPRFQILKERYRKDLNLDQGKVVRAIFKGFRVSSDFIQWASNLNNSTKNKVTEACNLINANNEILKFIVYSLMRSRRLYLTEIALISGSGHKNVLDCAMFLKKELKIQLPSIGTRKDRPQNKLLESFSIPKKVRNSVFQELKKLILYLQDEYNCEAIYFLKKKMIQKGWVDVIEYKFEEIIANYRPYIDKEYLSTAFNISIEILDYLTGWTQDKIATTYNKTPLYIADLSHELISDPYNYSVRFGIKTQDKKKETIKKIAEEVVNKSITKNSFPNILNEHLQFFKRRYYDAHSAEYREAIFHNFQIPARFTAWLEQIKSDHYKTIFKNHGIPQIKKESLILLCDRANINDEIRKYAIYSLLKERAIDPAKIARIAGIRNVTIKDIGKVLSNLTNPRTRKRYINYKTRFKFEQDHKDFPKKLSLTPGRSAKKERILILPVKVRNEIVQKLNGLLDEVCTTYQEDYLVRDLLFQDYKTLIEKKLAGLTENEQLVSYTDLKREPQLKEWKTRLDSKFFIYETLKKISHEYEYATEEYVKELFFVVLDVRDVLFGGQIKDIVNKSGKSEIVISPLAKLIIPDPKKYRVRFYNNAKLKQIVLEVAEEIATKKVTPIEFSNLTDYRLQTLMERFRKEFSLGKSQSVFQGITTGVKFPNWIKNGPATYRRFKNPVSRNEVLKMCSEISWGLEIVKYAVYAVMYSTDRLREIVHDSGAGISLVRHCAKYLSLTRSPSLKTFYLKDYDQRFPIGRL